MSILINNCMEVIPAIEQSQLLQQYESPTSRNIFRKIDM